MMKLIIDKQDVEVAEGTTVLAAAQKLGIDIPTMCFLDGCTPSASCMICVVKDATTDKLTPACSALAEDGMNIITDDSDVLRARKQALELLLSDHIGDCAAPCEVVCPANIRIPRMIRQIRDNDRAATSTALNNTAKH
jgi:NADH dehydrogenase/NADH:ubiquinone oxidoreductase subunit G